MEYGGFAKFFYELVSAGRAGYANLPSASRNPKLMPALRTAIVSMIPVLRMAVLIDHIVFNRAKEPHKNLVFPASGGDVSGKHPRKNQHQKNIVDIEQWP